MNRSCLSLKRLRQESLSRPSVGPAVGSSPEEAVPPVQLRRTYGSKTGFFSTFSRDPLLNKVFWETSLPPRAWELSSCKIRCFMLSGPIFHQSGLLETAAISVAGAADFDVSLPKLQVTTLQVWPSWSRLGTFDDFWAPYPATSKHCWQRPIWSQATGYKMSKLF